MDDPAGRVERWVPGGGLERGLAGEAVGRGPVRQQAVLPEEGLRQVAPIQLGGKVLGAPSEQFVPAPAQQDLVLRGDRGEGGAARVTPETPWDSGAGVWGVVTPQPRCPALLFLNVGLSSVKARAQTLGSLGQ